jgi:hypothetical protein
MTKEKSEQKEKQDFEEKWKMQKKLYFKFKAQTGSLVSFMF